MFVSFGSTSGLPNFCQILYIVIVDNNAFIILQPFSAWYWYWPFADFQDNLSNGVSYNCLNSNSTLFSIVHSFTASVFK